MLRLPVRPLTRKNAKKRKPFRLGYVFTLPKLSDIPFTDWQLDDNPIENQALRADVRDDMCAPFALTSTLEPQEGEPLDPGYQFAKAKQREGRADTFGTDLDTIGYTAVKYGALAVAKSPFPDRPRSFVADWTNWPPIYDQYASEHQQGAMLWVDGPYDLFDNIRAALWLLKTLPPSDKRAGILAASYWPAEWQYAPGGVIPKTYTSRGTGHAYRIRGQKIIGGEAYLVLQNSYGTDIGWKGLYYLPREACNRELKLFGQIVFVDRDPDEIRKKKISIAQQIVRLIEHAIYLLRQQRPASPTPTPIPSPEPATPSPVPESLQDMARRVCREEGLSPTQTRELLATIHAESAWDPKAINKNTNGTADYGLCQLNSYWYIGRDEEVKTPEEALANPEKCVRVMAKAWRNGRAIDWYGYRDGHYKKHLHLY
jgi:hypothetical protein